MSIAQDKDTLAQGLKLFCEVTSYRQQLRVVKYFTSLTGIDYREYSEEFIQDRLLSGLSLGICVYPEGSRGFTNMEYFRATTGYCETSALHVIRRK